MADAAAAAAESICIRKDQHLLKLSNSPSCPSQSVYDLSLTGVQANDSVVGLCRRWLALVSCPR